MSLKTKAGFSIIIPSWNNLEFLKLCIESIKKNSAFEHEIIVHVNDGSDGSYEWVSGLSDLKYTFSEQNIGICSAVNRAFNETTREYIVYMNDDMYVCPGWDTALMAEIESFTEKGIDLFFLSATMIEPRKTSNACVIQSDFGDSLESFDEQKLLAEFLRLEKQDWSGSTWPPCLMARSAWEAVGGFSEEFDPGAYSDPDLSMKLWQAGCRYFKGVGVSRVYHFASRSTGRIKLNDGRRQFLKKWGILSSTFIRFYLKRGAVYRGKLSGPGLNPLYLASYLRSKIYLAFS